MATKNVLPTNYQDDIIADNMGGKRRYNLINNPDGTVSLEDVTKYTQVGSDFNAKNINATNTAINACYSSTEVDNKLNTKVNTSSIVNNASTLLTATNSAQVAGAVGIKGLKDYIPTVQSGVYQGDLNSLATGIWECLLAGCKNYPHDVAQNQVTVLSYKNKLQILTPSGVGIGLAESKWNGDYFAIRRCVNNNWDNWVTIGGACGFNDAYKTEPLKDALSVDLNNPYGASNRTVRVDRERGSYNLPKNCLSGVREVTWVYNNWVILRITGVDTEQKPRMWTTEYRKCDGYQGWKDWSMITQGLDRGPVQNIYAGHWDFGIDPSTTRFLFMSNSAIKDLLQVNTPITQKNTAVFITSAGGYLSGGEEIAGGNYSLINTNLRCYYMGGGWYCELDPYATAGSSGLTRHVEIDWLIVHWGDYDSVGAKSGIG